VVPLTRTWRLRQQVAVQDSIGQGGRGMARVRVGDIEVHYEEQGQGSAVVLVHGLGNDLHLWDEVATDLARLHRVIRYDVRGFGETDRPAGPYTLAGFAIDLAGLLDALAVDRAHVMGLSMGGVIAQRLALDFPQRVRSLVLVSTSSEVGDKARAAWLRLADVIESRGFDARSADASRAFSPEFAERHPEIVAATGKDNAANDPRAYAAAARASGDFAWTAELGRIGCPVLIVQGLADRLTPPGGSVKMARGLRRARLLMLEGAGHNIQIEQPVALANAALGFFAGVDLA
jgi:3-oxoadipate enol-lactonase